jgi:hypothetical protein
LEWNDPILAFTLEQHGGTVLGSSRADLERWIVNLNDGTAHVEQAGGC